MELPITYTEFRERGLNAFIEVYISSPSIPAAESLFQAVKRRQPNTSGAIIIDRGAIEILGASLNISKIQVWNLNRSGLTEDVEQTPLQDCKFELFLASIQPNLKRSHVERALNSIFRSAKIPFECLETEFTSARAIKIPSDQVLEEASPNKFRYVIRNYDSLSNP